MAVCRFLDRELLPLLVHVTRLFAPFVGAQATDLVFVPSATIGLNTVIASCSRTWAPGDEVVVLDIGYGAVKNMVEERCKAVGSTMVEVAIHFPLLSEDEVVDAVAAALTPRTRLAVFDHVTSNTALLLPVERLAALCHQHGVTVLIDGAHALGMLDLNLPAINADYYVANCHKWFCSPRGCAFLWAQPPAQHTLRPLVISHGVGSGFISEFIWDGNRDYSPTLSLIVLLKQWSVWGPGAARRYMHTLLQTAVAMLCEAWGTATLAPMSMHASMALVGLPCACAGLQDGDAVYPAHAKFIQDTLYHTYKIEVPVKVVGERLYVRLSAHIHNTEVDYVALKSAVGTMVLAHLGKTVVCTKGGGCG